MKKTKKEVASLQSSNNYNKSQYFRSFRYASKRFFTKKNNTMTNSTHVNTNPTSHNNNNTNEPDSDNKNQTIFNSSSSSFEKLKKSKSQTELRKNPNNMDTASAARSPPNSISSVVKNFRNSLTNFSAFNNDVKKEAPEAAPAAAATATNVKVRDVKMRGRVKNNNTDKSTVPLAKPRKSPVPSLTLEPSARLDQEEQETQNENVIDHLKKQIDLLVEQLESVEREDSKIISELSEKIDNIARMNSVSRLRLFSF